MLERYGDTNEYKGFKSAVHEALYPGEDAPPLPKASKWFPQDRVGSQNDEAEESEQSDEDVYISGARQDFKCPLTLRVLKDPYTNKRCKHTYEKADIIAYINSQGINCSQSQARGPRNAVKQIECALPGCDNMLRLDDFYDDHDVVRRIRRANRQAAFDVEDEEEDQVPRGTQRSRPEEVDDESGEDLQQKMVSRIKRERQSRSLLPESHEEADAEVMDED